MLLSITTTNSIAFNIEAHAWKSESSLPFYVVSTNVQLTYIFVYEFYVLALFNTYDIFKDREPLYLFSSDQNIYSYTCQERPDNSSMWIFNYLANFFYCWCSIICCPIFFLVGLLLSSSMV